MARGTASSSSSSALMAAAGRRRRSERRGRTERGEWIGEASGSLSPSSPARGGGQAGTQVRGRAGGRGGHLLLPTGAREGTSRGDGLGQA